MSSRIPKMPAGRRLMSGLFRVRAIVLALAACAVGVGWAGVAPASAAQPWWHVNSSVRPASIARGGEGVLVVQGLNIGDAVTSGVVTLTAALPAGVQVVKLAPGPGGEPEEPKVQLHTQFGDLGPGGSLPSFHFCSEPAPRVVRCSSKSGPPANLELPLSLVPFEQVEMMVAVEVESGASSGGESVVEVSGGAGGSAQARRPFIVSEAPTAFGIEHFSLVPEEEGGAVDARAGSHPFQLTETLNLNQDAETVVTGTPYVHSPALPRNFTFKLPAGLVGNATALPQCTDLQFRTVIKGGTADLCPVDSAMGVATVTVDEPVTLELKTLSLPVFNLTPEKGEPARFGFEFAGTPVSIDTSVRTGSDYGATATVSNTTELTDFISSTVTFWGVPGLAAHNEARGWGCLLNHFYAAESGQECVLSTQSAPSPFLTMPTSCGSPFTVTAEGDSWPLKATPTSPAVSIPLQSTEYSLTDGFGRALEITGCNQLAFAASIEATPDVQAASSPTGFTVRVHVPQEASENAAGLAASAVKGITVTLPEGMAVNPASAGGLEACSEGQIGFQREEPGTGRDLFTSSLPSPFCPLASKVATARIKTPLLANPIEGAVYLATQNENPFGSLIAMYIVAEDPVSGVLVKLPGRVSLNGETGQIVSTFEDSPEVPFEDAEFHFFEGPRAPLSNPAKCTSYTTRASFTPWSGGESVASASTFKITAGPGGSPCPNSLPFAPTLSSGTVNINAGAFSPLITTLSREDGDQALQTVQLHYPPGLSGVLTGVRLCPDAQANAGTCGSESLIGHTTASVGLGSEPFTPPTGEVFLTEGYEGAPFGLSIVTPAVAGPFNLGKVIVRGKIEIDPHTGALTVTTDPIPHILDGIPLQIKHVNVAIDRPGFTFNPTSCAPMSIAGTITSVEGATSPVSTSFQVANCALLKFAPKFTVTTSGKTSKSNGASLTTKLTYPTAPPGSYANIAKVKVDLPKQLPSRLTTLQKACLAAVFEKNPASCPAPSIVGHAKAIVPNIPVPLEGPAYFVSHGNEAFPSLTIVLQGYGITIDLTGSTLIRHGITSTTFHTIPDNPVTSFELTLPQGKYSALAANGSLCKAKLSMPTAFVAQNGLEIHQATPIHVTGCSKPKPKPKPKAHARKH